MHNGLKGHPRPLIFPPIERIYATSYLSPIVTWSYLALFQRYCRFSTEKSDLTPILPEFWGVPLGLDADVVAPRSEDPKLVIRVIKFEVTRHISSRYINVRDRQTDGRLTIAIRALHYVHHALKSTIKSTNKFFDYKYEWYCIQLCYNSRKKRLKPASEDFR